MSQHWNLLFQRLSTAKEEIIEVLLSKQQLLPALRFVNCFREFSRRFLLSRLLRSFPFGAWEPLDFLRQHFFLSFRFIRSVGAIDSISARKFLDAAKNSEDRMLFYTVFKFFEQRNVRLRGNPRFAQGWLWLKKNELPEQRITCDVDNWHRGNG